jgi:Guanylate-binding protein, N-terminal domain
MSHTHAYGSPLSIIKFNGSVDIQLDKAGLEGLLLHPEVVILSIVGAFRKGKSFFLDYCLRFLYGHVSRLPALNDRIQ